MYKENKKHLALLAREFPLSEQQAAQMRRYVELMEQWSKRTNLVSRNDVTRLVSKHISESLEIERQKLLPAGGDVLDLGSGAGFPGMPLAILRPRQQFTLLDSRRIKSLFLQEVVDECRLANVRVVCDRIESFGAERFTFRFVLSRAVAALDVLWRWSAPVLEKDGMLIVLKGGDIEKDVAKLRAMADVNVKVLPFENNLPGNNSRKIIVVSLS